MPSVRQTPPPISSAFWSAASGFVLYLIRVAASWCPPLALCRLDHQDVRHPAKDFGRNEDIWHFAPRERATRPQRGIACHIRPGRPTRHADRATPRQEPAGAPDRAGLGAGQCIVSSTERSQAMTTAPAGTHRVVIVGAGFGGLEAAHRLAGAPVEHHADRPPQPSSVPAAAVSGRDRVAGDLGDRLADPLSVARIAPRSRPCSRR